MIGRRGFIGSLLAAFAAPKLPVPVAGTISDTAEMIPMSRWIPVQINQLWGQDFTFTDEDLKLSIAEFGERYLRPVAELGHRRMLDDYRRQVEFMIGD